MKTFTFSKGTLTEGIRLTDDPKGKLGKVVFLGEEGRGRRYERVGLKKNSPPQVVDGKVLAAEPTQITLRRGQPDEFSFWVLSAPTAETDAVLVRIRTEGTYTRDSHGGWRTVEGKPETVIAGSGAETDSARLCSWRDGLVVMRPGDVLKITLAGGHKFKSFALFFDAEDRLTASFFEDWEAGRAAEKLARAAADSEVEVLFGTMPTFSFGHLGRGKGWGVTEGIETQVIPGGRGLKLGPRSTNWRSQHYEVIACAEGLPETVVSAAVGKTNGNLVFLKSERTEGGKFLVRVDTDGLRKRGRTGATPFRGEPTMLARGTMEHGTANPIAHYDELWVMGDGDVLRAGQVMAEKLYPEDHVLYVEGGKISCQRLADWERQDAGVNPEFYRNQNRAVPSQVPPEWIGRVVMTVEEESLRGERYFDEKGPHALVSIDGESKVTVDYGWDDPTVTANTNITRHDVWWVVLRSDLHVTEGPSDEELARLEAVREHLKKEIEKVLYFEPTCAILTDGWRERLRSVVFHLPYPEGLEKAKAALAEFEAARPELEVLHARIQAGETLPNFGGTYRRGGMTRNEDWWVVRPDGSLREADESRRKEKIWTEVVAHELALHWFCKHMGNVAANSIFEVCKMPVGGGTPAQLEKVREIEQELGVPNGFGSLRE